MQFAKLSRIALGLFLALSGSQIAFASEPIERSGKTFHVAVCGRGIPHGVMRCFAHVKTDARGNIFDGKPNAMSPNTIPSGFGPADLRSAYKVNGTGSRATTIAIVDAYGYVNAEADLAIYRAQYGLPPCTRANGCFAKYNQSGVQGSYPRQDNGWAQESALDLDMASAICPGCRILLIEATVPSADNLAAAVNTAARLGAHVISNSYGGNENGTFNTEAAYDHPGVAITVSSGDNGYGVQFPASSPHVTAVGGTSLYLDASARGFHEVTWAGSGSGCSATFAKPVWQKDLLCVGRSVADVSAVADPNTGVAVYGPVTRNASGWQVYGGTSAAAPIIGGIYAVNGNAVNFSADPYASGASLFDVISGTNGSCGGTYLCVAGQGYDGPTGLGSPNGVSAF